MNRVVAGLSTVAIFLATIGMTGNAFSGARTYDLNLLLDEPHPYAAGSSTLASGMPSAGQAGISRPAPAKSLVSRRHDYTFNIRFVPWLMQPDGDIKLGSVGATIDVDDDLGFDDYEFNLAGSANLRLGRHDFWFDALSIDMSTSNTAERTFTYGSITIPVSRAIESDIDVSLYDFRYGYSFFELESDGFRLGPTIGVAYFNLKVKVTDLVTGADSSIDEEFPIPRIGVQGAIPYGNFQFEGELSGLFIDYDDFKGYAVEGDFSVAWRPYGNLGLVGGYRVIAADVDYKNDNFDITFHGPYLGVEIRY